MATVNEKMTAIADSIRAKTGGTEKLNLDQMASSVGEVYSAGFEKGKAEGGGDSYYDVYWDTVQNNGEPTDYSRAFSAGFRSLDIFKPKYDLIATNAYMMFAGFPLEIDLVSYLQSIGRRFDVSRATNTNYMFQGSKLTRIGVVDFSGSTNSCPLDSAFANCFNLVTIDKVILKTGSSGEFISTFNNCNALENLTLEGTITKSGLNLKYSNKLSKASIKNIIGCLSTTTSGQSITLSKTAKEAAFTDDEWAALIATRPNWTISLV